MLAAEISGNLGSTLQVTEFDLDETESMYACVDAPSHEVHQDTDTTHGRIEPGNPENSTQTLLKHWHATNPLTRYRHGAAWVLKAHDQCLTQRIFA
jgi:hypothetical protein